MTPELLVGSITLFVLSIFLGFELITKVPAMLHTPLMSGANAISGISVVGALIGANVAYDGGDTLVSGLLVPESSFKTLCVPEELLSVSALLSCCIMNVQMPRSVSGSVISSITEFSRGTSFSSGLVSFNLNDTSPLL